MLLIHKTCVAPEQILASFMLCVTHLDFFSVSHVTMEILGLLLHMHVTCNFGNTCVICNCVICISRSTYGTCNFNYRNT